MFARRTTRWAFCLLLALVWALAVGAPAWAWSWPVDGAVLRGFSVGADKYAAGQHRGIDVALDGASAVRAPTSGDVTFAGPVPTHGLTVTITTGGGYMASLTHLGVLRVERGDRVTEGEAIADQARLRRRQLRRSSELASAAGSPRPSAGTHGAVRASPTARSR
jgi:septal ring factor EnvC (AmiA/AmiB activator)